MATVDMDLASELLVAQLIEQDLDLLRQAKQAEALQLEQVIAASAELAHLAPGKTPLKSDPFDEAEAVVLEMCAEEARLASDAIMAERLENEYRSALFADQLLAQKMAAEERKTALDAEISRRLDELQRGGNMNVDSYQDLESLVDADKRKEILGTQLSQWNDSAPPASKNDKGKGKAVYHDVDSEADKVDWGNWSPSPYDKCGICLEPFQPTHAPINAALTANSSIRVAFGIRLPCPSAHGYCISCATHYIQTKLDPDGSGKSDSLGLVFPILCPECPAADWPLGIDNAVAERILDGSGMAIWHHRRLLDSIPRIYCPNPKCSVLVEAYDDPEEPHASCPACGHGMCVQCRVPWHENLSCEQFQQLPPDERSREDQLLLELAKIKNWRRCPKCAVVVELAHGCNHITCRCGFQFCFRCCSTWKNKCTSKPPCDLWEEEMLLDAQDRRREQAMGNPAPAPARPAAVPPRVLALLPSAPVLPAAAPPRPVAPLAEPPSPPTPRSPTPQPAQDFAGTGVVQAQPTGPAEFGWMDDPTVLCSRHWFTASMIRDLRCGYCSVLLNSLADLRYHLAHARRHPVYACCGRFFRYEKNFEQHRQAYPARFGGEHVNRYISEAQVEN